MSSAAAPTVPTAIRSGLRDLLLLFAFLAIGVLANPDKAKHDQIIRQQVRNQSPIASIFGAGRLASWVADYHSIGIASYTTIDGKVVTMGAFGIVIPR
jgi:hypothetical protein